MRLVHLFLLYIMNGGLHVRYPESPAGRLANYALKQIRVTMTFNAGSLLFHVFGLEN